MPAVEDQVSSAPPPPPGFVDVPHPADVEQSVIDEAKAQGVDPHLARSVAKNESAFDPSAKSPAGAAGVMQLMPSAQKDMGVTNPYDPDENIRGGVRLLKQLQEKYPGDLQKAIQAYHAGPGNVDAGKIGPATTAYTAKVLSDRNKFAGSEIPPAPAGFEDIEPAAPLDATASIPPAPPGFEDIEPAAPKTMAQTQAEHFGRVDELDKQIDSSKATLDAQKSQMEAEKRFLDSETTAAGLNPFLEQRADAYNANVEKHTAEVQRINSMVEERNGIAQEASKALSIPQAPKPAPGQPQIQSTEQKYPSVGFISPQANRPYESMAALRPKLNDVDLPLVGKVNIPGAARAKEEIAATPILHDAVEAAQQFRQLIWAPADGVPLKSDSKLETAVNGFLRGAAGFTTPEAVATWIAGAGIARALPALANSPTAQALLKANPILAKGVDIAANGAVPLAFGVMGTTAGGKHIASGVASGDMEQVAQGLLELGVGGAALTHATLGGKATLARFPGEADQPPAPAPGSMEEKFGVPVPPTEQEAATARAKAEAAESEGAHLAAQQWRDIAQYTSPVKVNLGDLGVGTIVPLKSGRYTQFHVLDSTGKTLVAGDGGTVSHWLRIHSVEEPSAEAGGAVSVGAGAAETAELPQVSKPASVAGTSSGARKGGTISEVEPQSQRAPSPEPAPSEVGQTVEKPSGPPQDLVVGQKYSAGPEAGERAGDYTVTSLSRGNVRFVRSVDGKTVGVAFAPEAQFRSWIGLGPAKPLSMEEEPEVSQKPGEIPSQDEATTEPLAAKAEAGTPIPERGESPAPEAEAGPPTRMGESSPSTSEPKASNLAPESSEQAVTSGQTAKKPLIDVKLNFPLSDNAHAGLMSAASEPHIEQMARNAGVTSISVDEPHTFQLSQEGGITAQGLVRLNPNVSDLPQTLRHEIGEIMWARASEVQRKELTQIAHDTIDVLRKHAPGYARMLDEGDAREAVAETFGNYDKLPEDAQKRLREFVPQKPFAVAFPQQKGVSAPERAPSAGLVRSWDDIAEQSHGNISERDDLAAITAKYGERTVVIKDVNGGRHILPSSMAAKALANPLVSGHVREVFTKPGPVAAPKLDDYTLTGLPNMAKGFKQALPELSVPGVKAGPPAQKVSQPQQNKQLVVQSGEQAKEPPAASPESGLSGALKSAQEAAVRFRAQAAASTSQTQRDALNRHAQGWEDRAAGLKTALGKLAATKKSVAELSGPTAVTSPKTRADLDSIAFEQMPAENETEGVAKNKGTRYRESIFTVDRDGVEERFKVRVSSKGARFIEPLGKTKAQFAKETQAEYDALKPETKAALDAIGLPFSNVTQKVIVGDAMEGRAKTLSLKAFIGNAGVREAFQKQFPGVDTIDKALVALRKFAKENGAKPESTAPSKEAATTATGSQAPVDLPEVESKLSSSEAQVGSARKEYERLHNLHSIVSSKNHLTPAEDDAIDASEFGKVKDSDREDEIRKHLILAARKYDAARIAHDKALAEAAESNPMLAEQPESAIRNAEVPVDEAADSNLKASTDVTSDAIAQVIEEEKLGDELYDKNNLEGLQTELKYLSSDIKDLPHASPEVMATAKEIEAKAQKLIDRLGASAKAVAELPALPDGKVAVVDSWLAEHRVSTVGKNEQIATYGNHTVYPLTDGRLVWASNTYAPNGDILRQQLVAVSPTSEDLEPDFKGKESLREKLEEAIGYGELKPEARDRILKMFDREPPAEAPPAKRWDGTPVEAEKPVQPEVASEEKAVKPTGAMAQIAARRPLEPTMADVEAESEQGLTKAQQASMEYDAGWRATVNLRPGQEQQRILEVFDPYEWKWLPAGTYTYSRQVSPYGGGYRKAELSSHADEKLIATYPHVKPGPLTQDDLKEATKSFDADNPGVTVHMPKAVQVGMEKMNKAFSDTALWKFRQPQIKDAARQLAEWRKSYERSKEWDDLFTSALSRVLNSANAKYNEGVDAERRQNQKLQLLADRYPASATMETVKAESEKGMGTEESLVSYKDGWRIVKYYYKGKKPSFTLQRFDPKNWEWDASSSYAHNSDRARADEDFKDRSKEEPLTEADLQKAVSDTRETLKSYNKTKRTPEQIKAGEREQALPDHKPAMSKPFTYESKGEDVRYYLNFPNGEKWGPSPWQANVFGRDNIIDAWDGPRLDEANAKSYAIARWWDAGLDSLRKQKIYSGEGYDKKVQEMRDMAASILAPAGRPRVIATRQEGEFQREYSVIPTIRSNEHIGYQVTYKDPDGKWAQDHYNYQADGNTYDEAIEKWLQHESGDISKYQFNDPVARSVGEDLEKTNRLKIDMGAVAAAKAKAEESKRLGLNDELPEKASITLPSKTIKAMLPVLKRVVSTKTTIPILQNVAIVTRKGKTQIFATDLETAVTYTLDGVSKEDSAVTLPFSAIEAALKGKSKEDLKIETAGGKASLSVGSAESGAGTMSIANYPELPATPDKAASIPAQSLVGAIRATVASISPIESRFTLNGALLQLSPGKATMVATDGHRLSVHTFDVPGVKEEQPPLLIPRHALETISKVFGKSEGNVVLKLGKNAAGEVLHIGVETPDGSVKILSRKLTGNFPDWQRVMPDIATYTHKTVVGREDLLGLMQQALALKERSNAMALSFRNGQIAGFKTYDDKTAKGKVPATLENFGAGKGEVGNPRIGVDAAYVADFLKSTDADKVEILLKTGKSKGKEEANALLFHPVGEPDSTTLIMPMRDTSADFDDGLPAAPALASPEVSSSESSPEETPKTRQALGQVSATAGFKTATHIPRAIYRKGVVWTSSDVVDFLNERAGGKGRATGLYIPAEQAGKILTDLKGATMAGAIQRGIVSAISGPLRSAIAEAQKEHGNVVMVAYDRGDPLANLKATVRHERFHRTMAKIFGDAHGEMLLKSELGKLAADNLGRAGYDRDDNPTMWHEIGSHLASGPQGWERMGLDRAQAKELFSQYLKMIDERTIALMRHIAPALNEVIRADQAGAELRQAGARNFRPFEESPEAGELQPGVRPNLSGDPDAREQRDEDRRLERLKGLVSDEQGALDLAKAAAMVRGAKREIQKLLTPAALAPETALTVRQRAGELARASAIAEAALEKASTVLMRLPEDVRWDFYDKVETGQPQSDARLDEISKVFRSLLDSARKDVQDLGTGKLVKFIENYLPHIYKDAEKAERIFKEYYAKRPMEGSKSFLKRRKFETLKDAMEATDEDGENLGLEPVSDNPVDLVILKVREMQKYVMAHRVLHDEKAEGRMKYVRVDQEAPPNWKQINDKIGTVYGPHTMPVEKPAVLQSSVGQVGGMLGPSVPGAQFTGTKTEEVNVPGIRIMGHYYAPEDSARLINNYLSPGLRGSPLFRGYMSLANGMVQFQLGFSAFHLTFTTIDTGLSKAALGIYQAAHGYPSQGLATLAQAPIAPFLAIVRGDKMLKEYYKPGSQGAQIGDLVNAYVMAGGRAKMDTIYRAQAARSMSAIAARATIPGRLIGAALGGGVGFVKGGPIGAVIGGTAGAIFGGKGLADVVAKPIMEYVVPRLKAAVFADLAQFELQRLKEGKQSFSDVESALARASDSVDNRLGQLVYDNLFWNRMFKDILMGSVRAVGWRLGTAREILGGIGDIPKIATKQGLSIRTSYLFALALVGVIGGITHYLETGERPENLKDYYLPRSGPRGTPGWNRRLNLPTYVKDILNNLYNGPYAYLKSGITPFLVLMQEMATNKDYFDAPIRNTKDPAVKQFEDAVLFVLEQYEPFSMKPPPGKNASPLTPREKAQSFFGLQPAPAYLQDTQRPHREPKQHQAHF